MKKIFKFNNLAGLTLVTFLMNVMLPFVSFYHAPQSHALTDITTVDESSFISASKHSHCVKHELAAKDSNSQHISQEQPESESKCDCVLCYLMSQSISLALLSNEIGVLSNQYVNYVSVPPKQRITSYQSFHYGFHTRAPPQVA